MKIKNWSPVRILAVGFVLIILIGALLLKLPVSSRNGVSIPFINALFTSVSATCVTGLSVYDTWTQFSLFGQVVMLLLIQIGGLGFMTAVISIYIVMHRRITLRQRSILAESVGTDQLSGIVLLFRHVLAGTAVFEIGGAVLLAVRFVPMFGWAHGIWYALFHSISAFCNAGFDLMGVLSPGASLSAFYNDRLVVLTVSFLILMGGVGFLVWDDLIMFRREKRKLRLHTKVALWASGALVLLGTAAMLLLEYNGALAGMNIWEKLLNAFFAAVTPRTAGFSILDAGKYTGGGKLLTILYMFLGAAPGGTGGGVKITTIVVVLLSLAASVRNREDVSVGHFRLENKTVKRAFNSVTIYLLLVMTGTFLLCTQGVELVASVFECVSALSTVGLTLGVTSTLNGFSKVIVMLLMYAGRIGSLSVFLAVGGKNTVTELKNPVGKVIVG